MKIAECGFDETVYSSPISEIFHGGPESVRDIPCDICEFADKCAVDLLECSAFRNWATSGNYVDSDVNRHTRAMK
jgi:hypothetical protein